MIESGDLIERINISSSSFNMSIDYMEGFDLNDYSCYREEDSAGNIYSEGNCALVASYTIANFWMKSRHKDINCYNKLVYNPFVEEKDLFFQRLYSTNYNVVNPEDRNWPELYRRMRHTCYELFGRVEHLTEWNASTLVERTLNIYNVKVNMIEECMESYSKNVPNEILHNRPVLLAVCNNSVYKNHMLTICGYEKWKALQKFWIFTLETDLILAKVKDGWNIETRYFNFSTHHDDLTFCRIKEE